MTSDEKQITAKLVHFFSDVTAEIDVLAIALKGANRRAARSSSGNGQEVGLRGFKHRFAFKAANDWQAIGVLVDDEHHGVLRYRLDDSEYVLMTDDGQHTIVDDAATLVRALTADLAAAEGWR